ncbi:MAG: hypothetical protein ABSG01_14275 [Anaerolineales bacterium]
MPQSVYRGTGGADLPCGHTDGTPIRSLTDRPDPLSGLPPGARAGAHPDDPGSGPLLPSDRAFEHSPVDVISSADG